MTHKASIVIPVFNGSSLTRQCIDSILGRPPAHVDFEVVVVDDASSDDTPQLLAGYGDRIRVLRHDINRGFGISCNDGAASCSSEYLVFLNNDTMPAFGWLDHLVRYADQHPEADIFGAKLLYPNNTIQHAGVVIRQDRNPWHIYCGFPHDHPAVNKSRRVPIVTGACLLIRREVFEELRGFDEAYLNGYEDVDLCLRAGELGHVVHYCHESVLYHFEGLTRAMREQEVEYNTRLYIERWMHRVEPDDFRYYLEDGLVEVSYPRLYPAHFTISPQLAILNTAERDRQADRILHRRSQQVFELMKENILLNVRVQEGAPGTVRTGSPPARRPADVPPAQPRLLARPRVFSPGKGTGALVSVLVPVKNGANNLEDLLPRIQQQVTDHRLEIIAVDSGSEDESIAVLERFGAGIVSIDPRSFNHARTRNLATSYAEGEFFVFLTQRAIPADGMWLENLLAPLKGDPTIAGVCSRVLPLDDADVLTRKDGMRDLSGSAERSVRSITDWKRYLSLSHHELRVLINFHTVSCAIRPLVLTRVPFKDETVIGEDILWAKEVLEAGFKIQHEPSSRVHHSHSYSYLEVLQRCYDDGASNRQIVGRTLEMEEVVPLISHIVRDDWKYLREEAGLTGSELEEWQIASVLRRTAQVAGQWLGVHHHEEGGALVEVLSLTNRIMSGETGLEKARPAEGGSGKKQQTGSSSRSGAVKR